MSSEKDNAVNRNQIDVVVPVVQAPGISNEIDQASPGPENVGEGLQAHRELAGIDESRAAVDEDQATRLAIDSSATKPEQAIHEDEGQDGVAGASKEVRPEAALGDQVAFVETRELKASDLIGAPGAGVETAPSASDGSTVHLELQPSIENVQVGQGRGPSEGNADSSPRETDAPGDGDTSTLDEPGHSEGGVFASGGPFSGDPSAEVGPPASSNERKAPEVFGDASHAINTSDAIGIMTMSNTCDVTSIPRADARQVPVRWSTAMNDASHSHLPLWSDAERRVWHLLQPNGKTVEVIVETRTSSSARRPNVQLEARTHGTQIWFM
jgi:hypothetical protein